jgi:hypothetical protein
MREGILFTNPEVERIRKEVAVAYFKVLSPC